MAFSKAKLLRFNDVKTFAPPPGAYNPKYDELLSHTPSKISGQNKKQTDELPSPASSWTDVKSVRSCISSFRTPTIPKRKKINLFSSAGKKSASQKLFSPEKEELKEKIVECKNKDETIKDLEIRIDEFKLEINNLNYEKQNIIEEKNHAVQQVHDIQRNYNDVKTQLEQSSIQIEEMSHNLLLLKEEIIEAKQSKDIILPSMEMKLEQNSKYSEALEKEIQDNLQTITKLIAEHNIEIYNSNLERNEAVEELIIVRMELGKVNSQLERTTLENKSIKQTYEVLKKGFNEVKESQDIICPLLEEKLKLKISYCETLEQELQEKEEEFIELKTKKTEEIENITAEKHEVLTQLELVQIELEDVREQLMQTVLENDLKETYEILKESETKEIHELMKPFIEEYEAKLSEYQKEILIMKNQYEDSLQTQSDLQEWYANNTEVLKKQYQTEIEDIEYELLKIVTESQKELSQTEKEREINAKQLLNYENFEQQIKNDYEILLNQFKNETKAQIQQSEEDCSEKIKLAEIQMEENCKETNLIWKLKLQKQEVKSEEILKECQAIAEFNIIQCEVEKNDSLKRLEETQDILSKIQSKNVVLVSENNELKSKMSQIIIELNDTRAKLGLEIDLHQKDLETAIAEKHCYKITLNKTYSTVNALKSRLLHSDRDVEQLKEELENLETTKLDIETKYVQLSEEVQYIKKINEHLKSDNILLKEIQDKVIVLERELLGKVDHLKQKSDLKISNLNRIMNEKETSIDELNSYIQSQQKLLSQLETTVVDAKNEIDRQETEFIDYKFKISRLESCLSSSYKEFLLQGKTSEKKLKYINELEVTLKEKDKQIDEITSTYKKYIEATKHLTDIHQKHEALVQKNINLEKTMADDKKANDPLYYLINSKKNKVVQDRSEFEEKIKQQNKTIEKLKKEIAHLNKKRRSKSMVAEKENVCSPVRSQVLNSLIDSPASPLKERN